MKLNTSPLFVSALLLAAGFVTAHANPVTFDFYKLGHASGDFTPTDGVLAQGGDLASSDVNNHIFNGDLNFTIGGITATATATYFQNVAAVVQDKESGWTNNRSKGAGLGVYHYAQGSLNTSDDNITAGEMLTIKFDRMVNLTSIGLNDDGHNIFGQNSYSYLLNSNGTALMGTSAVNMIGQEFTFAYGGRNAHQFYLSSLTVSAVPDGGSTVSLIGAALIGLAALRRKFGQS